MRKKAAFGSAVDIYSREPDNYKYVPVTYYSDNGDKYSIERIASELVKGRTIVLIGDYGSGKSRCTKEVFEQIIDSHPHHLKNPISINLRDNWGLNRAQEILTRHFTDLGMNDIINDVMKVAYTSSIIYLLDGFDEIGAQTWSDDPTKLVSIRQRSLVGVKELISDSKGGILITGREHYFNNDAELITCLGLDKKSPIFIRCNQELSGEQFSNMLGSTFSSIPLWMPKKPLIAAIMRSIEPTVLKQLFSSSQGEFDFWNMLIDAFCIREANINKILDQEIIRSLYTKIARLARQTKTPLGPISIKQINDAFEQTTGRPPTDESAIVLQRLPGLSRIGAESLDRQFIDTYILDGLKAEDVIDIYSTGNSNIMKSAWINPLDDFGYRMISSRVVDSNQAGLILSFIKRHISEDNKILLSDLISSLFLIDGSPIDFNGCVIERGKFSAINFSNESIRNIIFSDCYFESVDITDSSPNNISITDSIILKMSGITGIEHMPLWIQKTHVDSYQNLKTLSAIREAGLSVAQTFLLSSLRKLFLQPGGGRKESSMYKGYGDSSTKKTCEKVTHLLVSDGFCQKYKGNSEFLYIPDRAYTSRVNMIMSQLTTSDDEIWKQVSRMR